MLYLSSIIWDVEAQIRIFSDTTTKKIWFLSCQKKKLFYIKCYILSIYENSVYLGEGLTNAVVFPWLDLGEIDDLDLGSITWAGLSWLVEHAIPWPCLCTRVGWLLEWIWGLRCCCEVEVLLDFVIVCLVNVGWGRVEGVPSASVRLPKEQACLLASFCDEDWCTP